MTIELAGPSLADYEFTAVTQRLRQQSDVRLADHVRAAGWLLRRNFFSHYFGNPPGWRVAVRRLGGKRILPDFVCLGSIKSGTSELATALLQHPSIVAPLAKEIWSDDIDSWRAYFPRESDMTEVRRRTGAAATGYFTPWLTNLMLAKAYREKCPDGRVVMLLRNPVDRAYSQYKWEIAFGGRRIAEHPVFGDYRTYVQTALDFFPVADAPTACGMPLLQSGLYLRPVQTWLSEFGSDRVHIEFAEDLFHERRAVLHRIHEFLGVEALDPADTQPVNENPLDSVPPHDPQARRLLSDFYRPWNEQLIDVMGRDPGWT